MTVGPVPGRAHQAGSHGHGRLARWAVWLAEAAVAVLVAGLAVLGVAYAVGGADAVEDSWGGYALAFSLYASLVVSFAAMLLGIVSRVRHESWMRLWLPLAVFPGLVVLVLVVEAFFIE
jgi:hypothetical protein